MKKKPPIKKRLKKFRSILRNIALKYKCKHITTQLSGILSSITETIPVFVISYNNGTYVNNITTQLNNFNIKPIIFDNHTICKKSLKILNNLKSQSKAHVIFSKYNFGHMIGFLQPIYNLFPETFAYTDPDLQLNKKLPANFLEILSELTTEFSVYKAGFALSLHGHGTLKDTKLHCLHSHPIQYDEHLSIEEFELRYWVYQLKHDTLELYAAPVDTTFALYRKSNYIGDFYHSIRVAGNFSAIHLPWFKELELLSEDDKISYLQKNTSSNWIQKNNH